MFFCLICLNIIIDIFLEVFLNLLLFRTQNKQEHKNERFINSTILIFLKEKRFDKMSKTKKEEHDMKRVTLTIPFEIYLKLCEIQNHLRKTLKKRVAVWEVLDQLIAKYKDC